MDVTERKFGGGLLGRLESVAEAEHQREAAKANMAYYWKNVELLAEDPDALSPEESRTFEKFCRDLGKTPDDVLGDIAAVRRARAAQPVLDRAADIRRQLSQAEFAVLNPPVMSPEMGRLHMPGYMRARRQELRQAEEAAVELVQAERAVADLASRKAGLGHREVML